MKTETLYVVVKDFLGWEDDDANGSVVLGYTKYLDVAKECIKEDMLEEREFMEDQLEQEITVVDVDELTKKLMTNVGLIEYKIEVANKL